MGSDIVFVFAWMPFIIAGGGCFGRRSVANVVAARQAWSGARLTSTGVEFWARLLSPPQQWPFSARVQRLGSDGSSTPPRRATPSNELSSGPDSPAASSPAASSATTSQVATASATPTRASPTRASPTASTSKPPGSKIGPASAVPVAGSAAFQDPATGDPALVVQPKAGSFLGFDAVCPHAGCDCRLRPAAGAIRLSVPRLGVQRDHRRG